MLGLSSNCYCRLFDRNFLCLQHGGLELEAIQSKRKPNTNQTTKDTFGLFVIRISSLLMSTVFVQVSLLWYWN